MLISLPKGTLTSGDGRFENTKIVENSNITDDFLLESPDPSILDLQNLKLSETISDEAFDSITRLALRLFNVPVALVSIVDEAKDRQFSISHQGLKQPWRSRGQTPLSHSFCQYVKQSGAPLRVNDARESDLLKHNLAIPDLGVVAYLGSPVFMPSGAVAGALCVIDGASREWTDEDLETLADLARCVTDEIALRAALLENLKAQDRMTRLNAAREQISSAFMVPDLTIDERFDQLLKASCSALSCSFGRIVKFESGWITPLYSFETVRSELSARADPGYDAFTRVTAHECDGVQFPDIGVTRLPSHVGATTLRSGNYVGMPLTFDGEFYGVIEFFGAQTLPGPRGEEDMSILGIIAMFATAHLNVFGQIEMLRRSETALLQYISELRNPGMVLPGVR